MNDKLLRAFIEASGFEIETVLDYKEKKMHKAEAMRHNTGWGAKLTEYSLSSTHGCMLDIDEDGLYTGRLRDPIVDYKVTKNDGQYKMAYEALRNSLQLLIDNADLGLLGIELRKQIELCEDFIK